MRSHSSFIVSASPSQVNKDKGAWGGGGRKEHNYKKKKKKKLKYGPYAEYRAIIFMYNFI